VDVENDLYPLELVNSQYIKPMRHGESCFTCDLSNESGYKSYSMVTCGIFYFSHDTNISLKYKSKWNAATIGDERRM